MFQALGLTFNHGTGVKDKATGEIVATTPKEALDVLNKGYDLNLSQDILNDYFELMDSFLENFTIFKKRFRWCTLNFANLVMPFKFVITPRA
jgi:hypothetical protein